MSHPILGGMFDFDGNGDLNFFERAAERAFINAMMEKAEVEETEAREAEDEGEDEQDISERKAEPRSFQPSLDSIITSVDYEQMVQDLAPTDFSFYDQWDLEFMDSDERNQMLEDAGLDPDDYVL